MLRRLWLSTVVLLVLAVPALARRRALTPGAPGHCVVTTLVEARYAAVFAIAEEFVYFVDESGVLARVPRLGGEVEDLAEVGEFLPFAMTVDADDVYLGVLPFEALFAPRPGAILRVPKDGGVMSVFVSGVAFPIHLVTDATHLYWASAGTLDFENGSVAADGKIERVLKSNASRQTLAAQLSAPFSVALDGENVIFGESGIADGDDSVGLYRVARSGGPVTTITDDVSVGPMVLDGNTVVFLGFTETGDGVIAMDKTGGSPRLLLEGDSFSSAIRVADRRLYFLRDSQDNEGSELGWVSIDSPAGAVVVLEDLDGDDFLLDGCAAIVNTMEGRVERTRR